MSTTPTMISLECPSCGANMELAADGKKAVCPYCGQEMLIEKDSLAKKEYERQMAKARAAEDIKDLQRARQRKRRLKGWLIALAVFAVIFAINAFIPDSAVNQLVFPQTADPFEAVSVTFSGMSGEGAGEVTVTDRTAAWANDIRFEIVPGAGLQNGDTVTVKAKAPAGWRFSPSEKAFTVSGLTEWVLRTEQLQGSNLDKIHANTERLIREDWAEILSHDETLTLTMAPYRLYLFVANGAPSYQDQNVLYDAYEVTVTRADGSVFTSYEACRYASLKIPADGVLTADYGGLMGFNLGYVYGFSYSDGFAGWTDAAEMEADLRNARDGYKLAD